MAWLRRHRPSPTRVVAVVALVAAMAGTGFAAAGNDNAADKKIFKKVVKAAAPKLSVRSAKTAITATNAANATNATHAGDTANLGGLPLGGYESSSKFVRFAFTLAFGAQRDIATSGPLTLTAKCLQNATDNGGAPNRDIASIVISTSVDGAVFDGADSKDGSAADQFLDTTTPETDRVFAEDSAATGTINYDAGNQSAAGSRAPDGSTLGLAQDATGLGENQFGAGCVYNGVAVAGP